MPIFNASSVNQATAIRREFAKCWGFNDKCLGLKKSRHGSWSDVIYWGRETDTHECDTHTCTPSLTDGSVWGKRTRYHRWVPGRLEETFLGKDCVWRGRQSWAEGMGYARLWGQVEACGTLKPPEEHIFVPGKRLRRDQSQWGGICEQSCVMQGFKKATSLILLFF